MSSDFDTETDKAVDSTGKLIKDTGGILKKAGNDINKELELEKKYNAVKKELEPPLVPDKDFNDSDKNYQIFYTIVIPIICIIIFIIMAILSISFKTPTYLFFGLILLWLLIIYPIYY